MGEPPEYEELEGGLFPTLRGDLGEFAFLELQAKRQERADRKELGVSEAESPKGGGGVPSSET